MAECNYAEALTKGRGIRKIKASRIRSEIASPYSLVKATGQYTNWSPVEPQFAQKCLPQAKTMSMMNVNVHRMITTDVACVKISVIEPRCVRKIRR